MTRVDSEDLVPRRRAVSLEIVESYTRQAHVVRHRVRHITREPVVMQALELSPLRWWNAILDLSGVSIGDAAAHRLLQRDESHGCDARRARVRIRVFACG